MKLLIVWRCKSKGCDKIQLKEMDTEEGVEPRCESCHGLNLVPLSEDPVKSKEEFETSVLLTSIIPFLSGKQYEVPVGESGISCEYPGGCDKQGSQVLYFHRGDSLVSWYMCNEHSKEIDPDGLFFKRTTAKAFAKVETEEFHPPEDERKDPKAPEAKLVRCKKCKTFFIKVNKKSELKFVSKKCPTKGCKSKEFEDYQKGMEDDENRKFIKRLLRKAKILSEGKLKKSAKAYQKRIRLFYCTIHKDVFPHDDRDGEKPICQVGGKECENNVVKFRRKLMEDNPEGLKAVKVLQRKVRNLNKKGLPLSELGKKRKRERKKRNKFIPKKCPRGKSQCTANKCDYFFVTVGGKGKGLGVCGKKYPDKLKEHIRRQSGAKRKRRKSSGTYQVRK